MPTDLSGLPEVVDVLGERRSRPPRRSARPLDEALDRRDARARRGFVAVRHRPAQVHVVVDDHASHASSSASTSARSSAVVTFSSRRSPSTIRTRPPAASTSPAQSLASPPWRVRAAERLGDECLRRLDGEEPGAVDRLDDGVALGPLQRVRDGAAPARPPSQPSASGARRARRPPRGAAGARRRGRARPRRPRGPPRRRPAPTPLASRRR